jgi:hypothetical protein
MGCIQVQKIDVCWEPDDHADVRHLRATAAEHYGIGGCNWSHVSSEEREKVIATFGSIYAACEHYAEEERNRLEAFHLGAWQMMGCYATAELLNTRTRVVHRIRTAGLWGIESDSDESYKASVESEELDALNEELAAFGVDPATVPAVR